MVEVKAGGGFGDCARTGGDLRYGSEWTRPLGMLNKRVLSKVPSAKEGGDVVPGEEGTEAKHGPLRREVGRDPSAEMSR